MSCVLSIAGPSLPSSCILTATGSLNSIYSSTRLEEQVK